MGVCALLGSREALCFQVSWGATAPSCCARSLRCRCHLGVLGVTSGCRCHPQKRGGTNFLSSLPGLQEPEGSILPSEAGTTGDDGIVGVTVAGQDPGDRDRPRCHPAPSCPPPQPSFPPGLGCHPPSPTPSCSSWRKGAGLGLSSAAACPHPCFSHCPLTSRGTSPTPQAPQRRLLMSNYLLHHVPLDDPGSVRAETGYRPGFPLLNLDPKSFSRAL